MSSTSEDPVDGPSDARLTGTLSIWGVVGCSLGLMGLGMAININPQAPALQVGHAVPLVFVISTVGVLLVAYGFIRLCQSFNHAGSIYGFIGMTIGPRAGFVAGWTLLSSYLALFATCLAGAGLFLGQFAAKTGLWPDASWIPFALVAFAVIWLLAARDVKVSTRALLSLEGLTIAVVCVIAVVVFVKLGIGAAPDGQRLTASVFAVPGTDSSALFSAVTFGFLSFAGFEVASTLGEETANPRRVIPRALLGTVLFAGLFFTVVTAAESMGFGTDDAGVTAFTQSGALVGDLGTRYIGSVVGDVVVLGAGISAFGSALACAVGASRLLYAFGRDGFLSTRIGRTSPRHGTPTIALAVVMTIAGGALVLLRLFATTSGNDVFFWTATVGTLALIVAYLMCTIGATRYLFFDGGPRVRRIEILIPLAGIAFLLFTLFKNVYPVPDAPYDLFPYLVAAWIGASVVFTLANPGFARRLGDQLRRQDGLGEPSELPPTLTADDGSAR
ncbi:APC family permease [Pseudonocardia kujensis]|uniref:APC family permease n=1 Tax=Pseudonocardia kujensis TaxID=1128675 RepID=UPI001E408540|nr:APC family permease [Pseudonocardia kujensis]MCE0768081.1 APC family permease [Pseudonocardia kujensis]